MTSIASGFDPAFSTGDGSSPVDDFSRTFSTASTLITVVGVLVVIGILVSIGITAYRSTRMAKRGQNPFTIEEDLAHSAMRSRALAPMTTLEQRLAELDDLHRRGVITDEEHRAARSDALRT
ncbi:hypothetical protein DEJ16_05265 [Curtobacterium sp. MCJR17_055]|uniref:SHOCT domain-containing protein n=1 Tax=unclassified Curtobacterium TaxID=257496 RepID=UPI000D9D6A35|nr:MULTISPECIES: SHOCT domain-containing protein [unclassified Curtobacterium]PYY37745.1 hypothetical protein DEI87_01020 [Curtobacterium sp. MCBD17_029]PYY56773.1 hypothetical protein DEJ16_05265 [Curtobacterium sp. MCJR17_055]PYY62312.1 hypothetical protein DEJ26_02260 [Curtobacterium sp. MCPF17_015]WIB35938.1 SHOCT domain-containing protein [Curtobacterium sp. MCJR17_043]